MPAREWVVAGVTLVAILALAFSLGGALGETEATLETAAPTPTTRPTAVPLRTPTTRPVVPTETPIVPETLEQFIFIFNLALANGDVDWILDRVHPVALQTAGTDRCRRYIQNDFSATSAMVLSSVISGPTTVVKSINGETFEILDHYTAEVSLTFEGEQFDGIAEFAAVQGRMRWFTPCR